METPRIRIDNVDQISILVCHLIYSLGCPLSKDQLIEITSLEQAVNYFDLMQALETIGERLCTVEIIDGQEVYSNTKLGVKAAKEFGNDLPASVREKMFEEAVKVYTRDAMKKESLLAVRYAQNANGTCTIGISVKNEATGRQKYFLNVYTENTEAAEQIKNKLKASPKQFSDYLDDYFNK